MKTCKHDWELKPITGNWMWVCRKCKKVISYKNLRGNQE